MTTCSWGFRWKWPKSLTVKVPTVNEGTYTYGSAGR
jgi:hypothetical protein